MKKKSYSSPTATKSNAKFNRTYNKNGELISITKTDKSGSSTQFFETKADRRNYLKESFSITGSWLKILIALLFLSLILSVLRGDVNRPTFTGFLNYLQSAPSFATNSIFVKGFIPEFRIVVEILGVNIFAWLNVLLLPFIKILNVLVFLVVALANLVTYVIWVCGWFFGF